MEDFAIYTEMKKKLMHLCILEDYLKKDIRNLDLDILHAAEEV